MVWVQMDVMEPCPVKCGLDLRSSSSVRASFSVEELPIRHPLDRKHLGPVVNKQAPQWSTEANTSNKHVPLVANQIVRVQKILSHTGMILPKGGVRN